MDMQLTDEQMDSLPILPDSLLRVIGEYGMARTDGVSELEILHRWETLIAGIKDYARALLSQQVEAARNAALEWVNGTPYAVDKVWAIDERDLMHLLSVKIGAVYVDPVAAAERARVHIAPLPSSPAEQKGNV